MNSNNLKHTGLDNQTLAEIKAALLTEKKKLLEELNLVSNSSQADEKHETKFPEYGDKPDENAQEIDGYTTNLATGKILEESLRDIENALARIEEGSYGICKYCQKEINPKRLLARPVASACVECKSKLQNQV
jgi:RNA polymerase-binding protein DksA